MNKIIREKNDLSIISATATVTQGCYSFIQPLTLDDIELQLNHCVKEGYAVGIEYTYDPHPRNAYWDMWGKPVFKEEKPIIPTDIIFEMRELLRSHPNAYHKLVAFDNSKGTESCAMAFIVHRPSEEKGFRLYRQEGHSRLLRYTIEAKDIGPSAMFEEECSNGFFR